MLNTKPNMASFDDFYETLLTAHQDLSTEESHAMNARLVLILSNHIGDMAVLGEAMRIARARPATGESASHSGRAAITPVAPAHAAG